MEDEALQRLTALGVREGLTLNCRNTRPIARQTAVVSDSKWSVRARVDGGLVDLDVVGASLAQYLRACFAHVSSQDLGGRGAHQLLNWLGADALIC